ncbi:hypothetical protein BTN49_0991 [Candidatus Enterovibrio escicola]|uniref:Uncharacterized protein n=1 Tax=Candidatus Enterovibrio escicola TaxID=1927127 RepID=A0A2A5T5G4_9GAMM|nr:hypothetical protein BTN49_0991 [Candidatus Enterovibrio escacola]
MCHRLNVINNAAFANPVLILGENTVHIETVCAQKGNYEYRQQIEK